MIKRILVVDDEADMLSMVGRVLSTREKMEVFRATNGSEAMELLSAHDIDVMLTDVRMPGMSGFELLDRVMEKWPEKTVIMMTAYGSIENAVEAMRKGAYDYITKPFHHDDLLAAVDRAFERVHLLSEREYLQGELERRADFSELVGTSSAMGKVREAISRVSAVTVPVLITGESGTGKELVARAIHAASRRRDQRFVALNCSAIPDTLLESELFGYAKGAFTGAVRDKKGLVQYADGGTLFLDEIADASMPVQTKLLRALQEQKVRPIGSDKEIDVDARLLCATNRNLKELIAEKKFREDLYYRINVVSVHLSPLRERREDIPLLVEYFLKGRKKVDPEAMKMFACYEWLGNVRELRNVLERIVLFAGGDTLTPDDIPSDIRLSCVLEEAELSYNELKQKVVDDFNRALLSRYLTKHQGNATKAAEELRIERTNFQRLMRRYQVSSKNFKE